MVSLFWLAAVTKFSFLLTTASHLCQRKERDADCCDHTSHPPNNETLFRTKARPDHLMDSVILLRCPL